MAAAYEVYTFGGGAALDATFHMINSVLGSNNYKAALRIAMGFGFIWVLLSIAFKRIFPTKSRIIFYKSTGYDFFC